LRYVTLPHIDEVLRIVQVANICDRGYIGPEETLSSFGPLLQPKAHNPKVTLLLLFLNATREIERSFETRYEKGNIPERIKRWVDLAGVAADTTARTATGDQTMQTNPESLRRPNFDDIWDGFDAVFDLYLEDVRMDELAKANRLRMKTQHDLVAKWPYRVTQGTVRDILDALYTRSVSGWERYVELERAE
jgi:hypothetical protein